MEYELIENYVDNPLMIYDGCEAKEIIYKVKDKNGTLICKLDLWKNANSKWLKIIPSDELAMLDEILKFPRMLLMDGEKERIVSHVKDSSEFFFWPAYLVKACEDKFIVYFTLAESQPARYQCYVLAVLKRKE